MPSQGPSFWSRFIARLARRLLPPSVMRDKAWFELWQERGYHVTPVHFYEPVPDTRALGPELWAAPSELPGIDMNETGQLELLELFASRYSEEYNAFPRGKTDVPHQYYLDNDAFGPGDAETLYCMVRHLKPARVLEAGSGYSTMVAAEAALRCEAETGVRPLLTAIEPYPRKVIADGFPGLAELIKAPVQQVPLDRFRELQANDILFIDSSHVCAIGSDVNFLFLEVLPRLNPGVAVHVHDIFLPAEYPREWVIEQRRFFNEQYLLQAFLAGNRDFKVLWAGSFMRLRHPDRLARAFPNFDLERSWPGSFWMEKTG